MYEIMTGGKYTKLEVSQSCYSSELCSSWSASTTFLFRPFYFLWFSTLIACFLLMVRLTNSIKLFASFSMRKDNWRPYISKGRKSVQLPLRLIPVKMRTGMLKIFRDKITRKIQDVIIALHSWTIFRLCQLNRHLNIVRWQNIYRLAS